MKTHGIVWLMVVAAAMVVGGCATVPVESKAGGAKAECLVCKKNADLACVELEVDEKTPRTVVDGKTFYFCSEECKKAFEKEPGRYVTAK